MKLRALSRGLLTGDPGGWQLSVSGSVVALSDGVDAVVLVAGRGRRGLELGPALAWATKAGAAGELHVLVDDDAAGGSAADPAGVVARQALNFRHPPQVWRVEGAERRPVEPAPYPTRREPAAADLLAVGPLREAGADVVVEHGVVSAEIDGLEVGRVVDGALEVGVGKHDRAAATMMEAVRSADDVRDGVVRTVQRHRRPEALPHLLNRLARERWLRSALVAAPGLVGARLLRPVEPPLARLDLVEAMPAIALGEDDDGRPLVVACSVGVDLNLVPLAADARARDLPTAELLLVTPTRDQYPTTRALAARLARPARLVAVEGPWP